MLALALLDAVWGQAIHFHLAVTPRDALLLALGLGVMAGLRLFAVRRGAVMAEYFALSLAAAIVFAVLSYLCLASSGALADARLAAMDRALGFDWRAGYRFLVARPLLTHLLQLAYDSLALQALYFCVLLSVMNRLRELKEMFWLVLVAGLFTSAGALLFPALGPFSLYGAPTGSFLPEMAHLKSGQDLHFALAHMTGVVSFPSFHTAMALAYAWGFRNTGPVAWLAAGLNAVMLCAVPWFGGHYLCDMIAGASVMLLSLAIVRTAPRFSAGLATVPDAGAQARA